MARGDQIYVIEQFLNLKGVYEHHGIDCGDGRVIYLSKRNETIVRRSLAEFTRAKTVYVKHYRMCYISEDVVRRAESRLGEKFAYNLLFNNCEHFATWCKTGIYHSQQVQDFLPLLDRLQIESLSNPLKQALKQGPHEQSSQLVNQALSEIKGVWDDVQPRYKRTVQEIETWQRVAEAALKRDREDLARAALQRKQGYQRQAAKDKHTLDQLANLTTDLLRDRQDLQL